MLVPRKSFKPSLMFAGKARAYPIEEHLKGTSLRYSPALPANIRLDWKDMPGTNTLAYNENP
jgi:hypothetical protein